jgi:phage baseplate assembly protein W
MQLDFYLKIPDDPNYDPTQIEIEDDLFNFVQYIEMILTTNRGEVFGAPELGANLEAYLWNQHITAATIKSEINRQIFQLCPNLSARIAFDVEVQFFKGDITDSILVDIIIEGEKVLGIVSTPSAN